MTRLRIGGAEIASEDARRTIRWHVDPAHHNGFPLYDRLVTNGDPHALCDADFLSPVLLNVRPSLTGYAGLRDCRELLEELLASVPADVELAAATPAEVAAVGRLFSVLDKRRPKFVSGTTLAKVLHRKRPALVPLFDRNVRRVYLDLPNSPIPRARSRSWETFFTLLAGAIQEDLQAAPNLWRDLSAIVEEGDLTALRALDIVAWSLGSPRATPPS